MVMGGFLKPVQKWTGQSDGPLNELSRENNGLHGVDYTPNRFDSYFAKWAVIGRSFSHDRLIEALLSKISYL